MIQRPPTLGDAVQHLAVRRERDERWARRVILRERQKRLLCRACEAAIKTLRQIVIIPTR